MHNYLDTKNSFIYKLSDALNSMEVPIVSRLTYFELLHDQAGAPDYLFGESVEGSSNGNGSNEYDQSGGERFWQEVGPMPMAAGPMRR